MSTQCLSLDGDVGIPAVVALRDALLAAIIPGGVVRLDISTVADRHLGVVQFIHAARRHRRAACSARPFHTLAARVRVATIH